MKKSYKLKFTKNTQLHHPLKVQSESFEISSQSNDGYRSQQRDILRLRFILINILEVVRLGFYVVFNYSVDIPLKTKITKFRFLFIISWANLVALATAKATNSE